MKIRKDDMVMVQSGKDKGKVGKILKVIPETRKVIVSGINMIKRHQKPSKKHQHGGIIEMEGPIRVDRVMLVCPKCNLPTRTGHTLLSESKVRTCRKCEEIIDNV
ncbi:MAG: 50S ribosomal protein L24 [Candidatus Wallbacteria bacterium]|nr:50S ribosomal protein L24 [Candidatus Wallbacteria bacterium]